MIEWMSKKDPRTLFLKPGENVYFTESWPIDWLAGKYFTVVKNKVVRRDIIKTISSGGKIDYDLDSDNGWLPLKQKELYEINLTMKGGVLLYPMWPSSDYFLSLENPDYKPDYTSSTNRYIGFFEEVDIPIIEDPEKGGILKIYTVKGMHKIRLRLYNDSIEDEKVVLRLLTNMCILEEISKPAVFRKIQHYRDVNPA